jgi:predicted nucleic acid-binding Zn ribbon protein
MPTQFGVCNVCKKAIPMGTKYYRCSVSTCNSGRWKLRFCSVRCWDIHLPEARHRDAGAIEEMARPSGPR